MTKGVVQVEQEDEVQIVVVGAHGTGKSTLIKSAQRGNYPILMRGNIDYVLSNTVISEELFPYPASVRAMDTNPSDDDDMVKKLKQADVVLVTFSCDLPESFYEVENHWIPYLMKLEMSNLHVIAVGCKFDIIDKSHQLWDNFDIKCQDLFEKYPVFEACVRCSALKNVNLKVVFRYAARASLYPISPLYGREHRNLSRPLVRALQRIFSESVEDVDAKGFLEKDLNKAYITDEQFNRNITAKLLGGTPLTPIHFKRMKDWINDYLAVGVGVDSQGRITLLGFLLLHSLYILRNRYEKTWSLVTAFGYDLELCQTSYRHQHHFKNRSPDQGVELTPKAKEFVKKFFDYYKPEMGFLSAGKVDHIFSTELRRMAHLKDIMELNVAGGLSLDGLLSMFEFMAFLEPAETFCIFVDLGYFGSPQSALCITKGRRLHRENQQSERNVYQCFVFASWLEKSKRSALLNVILGRKLSENRTSTSTERFAARVVYPTKETRKTLILRAITEEEGYALLSDKKSFAACDVAIFRSQRFVIPEERLLASHCKESDIPILFIPHRKWDTNTFLEIVKEAGDTSIVSRERSRSPIGGRSRVESEGACLKW